MARRWTEAEVRFASLVLRAGQSPERVAGKLSCSRTALVKAMGRWAKMSWGDLLHTGKKARIAWLRQRHAELCKATRMHGPGTRAVRKQAVQGVIAEHRDRFGISLARRTAYEYLKTDVDRRLPHVCDKKTQCALTIHRLNGASYAELSREYKLSRSTIREAVVQFADSVGLKIPTGHEARVQRWQGRVGSNAGGANVGEA